MAKNLLDLRRVNQLLDGASSSLSRRPQETPTIVVDSPSSEASESPPPPEPQPLTEEHRRLLRFKSYSYPFLTENSWRTGSAYEDDEEDEEVQEVQEVQEEDLGFEVISESDWTRLLISAKETSFVEDGMML